MISADELSIRSHLNYYSEFDIPAGTSKNYRDSLKVKEIIEPGFL